MSTLYRWDGSNWVSPGRVSQAPGSNVPGVTDPPPGPDPAPPGITVAAGANLATVVAAGAVNDTFVLTAGPTQPYRLTTTLAMKQGQWLFSNTGAVIKGSVLLTAWTSDGAGHWYNAGPLPASYTDAGQCNINSGTEANPCQKREDVFVDGVQQVRYMTLASLQPGGVFNDYAADRVYLAANPAGHTVEMSSTARAVNASVTGGKLSGLTFQHFATPSQGGAVTIGTSGWIVEDCDFSYNHAAGLYLGNADSTIVRDNYMHHNGQLAIAHYSCVSTQILRNEFAYNNYMREYWALDWESGGIKITFSDNCLVQQNFSHHNNGVGIWLDIDNAGITVDANTIEDNASCGIRHEISFDAVISNNIIKRNGYGHRDSATWRNGTDGGPFATAGININCSGGGYVGGMGTIDVFGNSLEDNQNNICVQQRDRGNSTTYPTRVWRTQNVKVHNNTTIRRAFPSDQFAWGVTGMSQLNFTDDALYHSRGNEYYDNTYYVDSLSALRFRGWQTANNQTLTFAAWQAAGYDVGATASVASRPGFRVVASGDDGTWGDATTVSYSTTATGNVIGDFDATTYDKNAWARVKVDIPQGATITSAVLDVLPRGINGAIPTMLISAHKTTNASQPTSRTEISARPITTATVSWTPGSWATGTWLASPSIVPILQEIVDQSGWVSGNYVLFFMKHSVPGWSGVQQYISVTSYDFDPASSVGLIATWS